MLFLFVLMGVGLAMLLYIFLSLFVIFHTKPGVVRLGDKFYINRKLLGLWDSYRTKSLGYWFDAYDLTQNNLESWCSYDTKEQAFEDLNALNNKPSKLKPIKIEEY